MTEARIAALKKPGGRRREDALSAEQRAVLRFTNLRTRCPGNINPSDLDALGEHFNEDQIVALVLVIATANWPHRINDGIQTPLK